MVRLLGREQVDDGACLHHGDAMGELPDEIEVVRDEQAGRPGLSLQVYQKPRDGGLHGDIERGSYFVAYHETGLGREGSRNGDPLLFSSGEFVRVPFSKFLGKQHLFQQRTDTARNFGPGG